MLIDSHCHIDDSRYDADREAMIQRARDAGVGHFVTIGCDLETSRAAVALAQKHPFISATVGVHPHEVKHIQDNWDDELRALAKSKGVIAYQNAVMLRDIAKTVPLDRVLVETDAPYLTPVPHRGKRNEPAYVRHVAEKLAELHSLSAQEVEDATTRNTKRLFGIK